MRIPPTKPFFSNQSIDYILTNFRSILEGDSFLTMGRYCEEFEKKFARYGDTKYALTTSCGTGALEMIFQALGVKGHDVIVPTNTFAATAFAVVRAGGNPVFVDCGPDLTIDPTDVEDKITPRTKVITTVHIGGLISPDTYRLADICRKRGIYLVEDACHAQGSMLDGKKAGTFGIASALSFFSTKVITTGEGGMLITNNKEIYEKAHVLRDQAKIKKGDYQNYHEELGYNWRMTEVQALMGLAQLELLEEIIQKRNAIARIYDNGLDGIPGLTVLKTPSVVRHNYYKYIVFTKNVDHNKLRRDLREKYQVNLGGYVYEIPLHLQPVFSKYKKTSLPLAEDLCQRHICPPIFPTMTDDEARYVADSIKRAV